MFGIRSRRFGGFSGLSAFVSAALVLGGCAQDTADAPSAAAARDAQAALLAKTVADGLRRSRAAPGQGVGQAGSGLAATRSVADLPDHGVLAEPRGRNVRREGAYAWHPVKFSEEHALSSLSSGAMRLRTPDGRLLDLVYDRHEEHPSGDWTWIGHVKGMDKIAGEVIMTFGSQAVFGEIRQPSGWGPSLQVDTRDGVTWIGTTDYAALRKHPPRVPRDDAIAPPAATTAAMAAPSQAGAAVHAWTPGHPIIDLMLGYTAAYRSAIGSKSATVTRLNYLVDVMNAALATSAVNAKVRLVHTVEVSYQEADIYLTLDRLNGSVATPASLQPLRGVLRDRYGADFVGLLMANYPNRNNACGLANLGGHRGQTPPVDPAADQNTAFSVYNQVCDNAIKHELGHNWGLNHDQITSAGSTAGPYAYSFGYKTYEPDGIGFVDVMGYNDPGQTGYNYYSNPGVRFKGVQGGTYHTSNAALSLRNTLPYLAQFRPTKVFDGTAARNDVDGDGDSDIQFQNFNDGLLVMWRMDGSTVVERPLGRAMPPGGKVVASGDFNGDGRTDLLVQDGARRLHNLRSTGDKWSAYALDTAPLTTATQVVGAADLDGDRRDELLLVSASGIFSYWSINATTVVRGTSYHLPAGARLVATGDFNADDKTDLVWMSSSRQMYLWWSNGGDMQHLNMTYASIGRPLSSGWQVLGGQDMDGDGKSDLLFSNGSTRQFTYWRMNRNLVVGNGPAVALVAGLAFGALGDFNGDGHGDMLWRKGESFYMWFGNGSDPFPWQTRRLADTATGSWHVINGGVGDG